MLTAKTQYNLTNAREYFEEHLCVGDYYDEGQRVSVKTFKKSWPSATTSSKQISSQALFGKATLPNAI